MQRASTAAITGPARQGVPDDIPLSIRRGEFLGIVGAGAAGRSALLRLAAGPRPERGVVAREHGLFPWLTVEQNLLQTLPENVIGEPERRAAVRQQIDLVGLRGFECAYPHQLSGCMPQRAALARALAAQPGMLLLDDPFGALDMFARGLLRQDMQRIWERTAITTLLATQDVEEAVWLCDRIVVLRPGTSHVARIVDVPLARSRDRGSVAFAALVNDLRDALGEARACTLPPALLHWQFTT